MKNTTLCYLEKDNSYLMLHRVKKENDENHDKWIGVGGKLEDGETPYECARREILEETGLIAENLYYRGIITFVSDIYGTEYMHLFTCNSFKGKMKENCEEGVLEWVLKNEISNVPIWEGDKIFLNLINSEERFFSLKLTYAGDKLIDHTLEIR